MAFVAANHNLCIGWKSDKSDTKSAKAVNHLFITQWLVPFMIFKKGKAMHNRPRVKTLTDADISSLAWQFNKSTDRSETSDNARRRTLTILGLNPLNHVRFATHMEDDKAFKMYFDRLSDIFGDW